MKIFTLVDCNLDYIKPIRTFGRRIFIFKKNARNQFVKCHFAGYFKTNNFKFRKVLGPFHLRNLLECFLENGLE